LQLILFKQLEKIMNMYILERDLIDSLESEKLDILMADYPEDYITEMADNHVPIYYSAIAQCLADDTSLAELEDEGLAEGVTDVFKRIQIAIYERLSNVAYQWLYEAQEAAEIAEEGNEDGEREEDLEDAL
jgi:hypothetical protein